MEVIFKIRNWNNSDKTEFTLLTWQVIALKAGTTTQT